MGNIVSYMQENQQTFAELSFNSVDSLVLSTLAYFNFEVSELVSSSDTDRVLLHDVVALSDWDALVCASWLEDAKSTKAFLEALMASRRYRDTHLFFYVNERSCTVEKQFSATTFTVSGFEGNEKQCSYLVFRGTDGSFAGWKEDFNLCFKSVIPSQRAAAAYVSGVSSAVQGSLILMGHSKGGNLAEFSTLVADSGTYRRIKGVYNHDGPSFLGNPSPRINETHYKNLLHKTVPESSAFGMILERRTDYRVARSTALSVFQHEPFSWLVEEHDFVYQEELNPSARFFDDALDRWLGGKSTEERERFIDTIYELFASTNARTWTEFQIKILANTRQMIEQGSRLDPETRSFIFKTIGSLADVLKEETIKRFSPWQKEWLPRRREPYCVETEGSNKLSNITRRKDLENEKGNECV